MEFKEVVGLRRSIRFWQPWHPVEDEKLQAIERVDASLAEDIDAAEPAVTSVELSAE